MMNDNSCDDTLDFSDAEIRSELSRLGYTDIDAGQFEEFKKDLLTLVQVDRSSSFSSQHSRTQPSRYPPSSGANRYTNLYEPPSYRRVPAAEKENLDSISSLYVSAEERVPFSSSRTNTSYRTTHEQPMKKPAGHCYRDEAARSLPVRRRQVEDYYSAVDESPDRPRSADDIRRYSNLGRERVEESADLGDVRVERHLDDYWYGDQRGGLSPVGGQASPHSRRGYHRELSPRLRSPDFVTASQLSSDAEGTFADALEDKLNLSRGSQSSLIKRKVSRRMKDGTAKVYEESYVQYDSDADTDSVVRGGSERLEPTYINDRAAARPPSAHGLGSRMRPPSARYDKTVDPVKSAVIWPEPKPIVSRNTAKIDPVNRFQQYQQEWSKTKVPEEKKHKNLRWAVREQMLYRDIIYEKPQKKFVENRYVVPTDKKRKDLRWRIRADMAAGILPTSS